MLIGQSRNRVVLIVMLLFVFTFITNKANSVFATPSLPQNLENSLLSKLTPQQQNEKLYILYGDGEKTYAIDPQNGNVIEVNRDFIYPERYLPFLRNANRNFYAQWDLESISQPTEGYYLQHALVSPNGKEATLLEIGYNTTSYNVWLVNLENKQKLLIANEQNFEFTGIPDPVAWTDTAQKIFFNTFDPASLVDTPSGIYAYNRNTSQWEITDLSANGSLSRSGIFLSPAQDLFVYVETEIGDQPFPHQLFTFTISNGSITKLYEVTNKSIYVYGWTTQTELEALQNDSGLSVLAVPSILWPVAKHRISGYRYGNPVGHFGLDIGGDPPIFASETSASGGVQLSQCWVQGDPEDSYGTYKYGCFVKIKHASGYCTLYAHLELGDNKKPKDGPLTGSSVTKGQKIGIMGNTGVSDGTHLHLEYRKPGCSGTASTIDPELSLSGEPGSNTLPAPTNLRTSNITRDSVKLTWDYSSSNIDKFEVVNSKGVVIGPVGKEKRSEPITGLRCGTDYSYYLVARKGGQSSNPSNTVSFKTSPCPVTSAEITNVSFSSVQLASGQQLKVQITVRNNGNQIIKTLGPDSGFIYNEGETSDSRGYPDQYGKFRVGIDFNGRTGKDHPYRWGLGGDLAPGQSRTIVGYVRLNTVRSTDYWVGLVQEGVKWFVDNKYKTKIQVYANNACTDSYEANNSQSSASRIYPPITLYAKICAPQDLDWYRIYANSGATINARLYDLPHDYDMYIYNSSLNHVNSGCGTKGGTSTEDCTINVSQAGTYYIKVVGYDGVYSTNVNYKLAVSGLGVSSLSQLGGEIKVTTGSDVETVRYLAVPDSGYLFESWNVTGTGAGIYTKNPLEIAAGTDTNVVANFTFTGESYTDNVEQLYSRIGVVADNSGGDSVSIISIGSDREEFTRAFSPQLLASAGNELVNLEEMGVQSTGIYGTVTYNGLPIGGIPLLLRFFDGTSYSTAATTVTNANGSYSFIGVPGLNPGQSYYVRFDNPGNSAYLWRWWGNDILGYVAGSTVRGGDFDIADIPIGSPNDSTPQEFAVTFEWTPRNTSLTESYFVYIYDDNSDYSGPLAGHVSSFDLEELPSELEADVDYNWEIYVYDDENGFGLNYGLNTVRFATGQGNLYGRVTYHNTPDAGIPITLWHYDGSEWFEMDNTYTDEYGRYLFHRPPALGPEDEYTVGFYNQDITEEGESLDNRLWFWECYPVFIFDGDHSVEACSFDTSDVDLGSPYVATGAFTNTTFYWVPRDLGTDEDYRLGVFDADTEVGFSTPEMTNVGQYTFSSPPTGFKGEKYFWEVWVDNEKGYGLSYDLNQASLHLETVHLPIVLKDSTGTPPPCSQTLLFRDDFSNPNSGWPTEDLTGAWAGYDSEEYLIDFRGANWNVWENAPGNYTNYALKVNAWYASTSTGSYGLVFGMSEDFYNFYALEVRGNQYKLLTRQGSTWSDLTSWMQSGYINTGTTSNQLEVRRVGSRIDLYANGHYLSTVTDDRFINNKRVGVFARAYSGDPSDIDARFDNFEVWSAPCN